MKTWSTALAPVLALIMASAVCPVVAQDLPRDDTLANPEIEGFVAACARAVEQRSAAYQALLQEPLSCGAHLGKGPLVPRSSGQYRQRFDKASRQIVQESQADHQGIRGACETMALACIDRHPGLTPQQKMTALREIAVDGLD